MGRSWRPATVAVRGGQKRSQFQETSEALYLTSGYVYDEAAEAEATFAGTLKRFNYSRFGNPTVAMFEERLALMEGAERALGTATGMAAVFTTVMALLKAGDRIVSSRALFGSCHHIVEQILPKFGVEREFVDGSDLSQWERALSRPATMVFFESPSNPGLEMVDIAEVSRLAKKAGALVLADNAFATGLQRPLELGADLVVTSATKWIDGQGRSLGGAIMGERKMLEEIIWIFLRNTGASLSPFNAWLMLKGLETLELRLERHCANAMRVARFLETQPKVIRTLYPGLESHPAHALAARQMRAPGGIVAFEVAGGKEGAFDLLNRLKLISISNNLGDAKSLMTHPATTTHSRVPEAEREHMGITAGFVRLSVGLEDIEDIIEDLAQALA